MSNEKITYLTDAVLITAVVPVGRADASAWRWCDLDEKAAGRNPLCAAGRSA